MNKNFKQFMTESGFLSSLFGSGKPKPAPDLNSFTNEFKDEVLLLDTRDLKKLGPQMAQLNFLISKWYDVYLKAYNNQHGKLVADTILGILKIINATKQVPFTPTELFLNYNNQSKLASSNLIKLTDRQLDNNINMQKDMASLEALAADQASQAKYEKPKSLASQIPKDELEKVDDIVHIIGAKLSQTAPKGQWNKNAKVNYNFLQKMLVMMERSPGQANGMVLKYASTLARNLGMSAKQFVDILESENLQVGNLETDLEYALRGPANSTPAPAPELDPRMIPKEDLKNYADWVVKYGIDQDFGVQGKPKEINAVASLIYLLHTKSKDKDTIVDYYNDAIKFAGEDINKVHSILRNHGIDIGLLKKIDSNDGSKGVSEPPSPQGHLPEIIEAYIKFVQDHPGLRLKNSRNVPRFLNTSRGANGSRWYRDLAAQEKLYNYIDNL